MTKYQIRLWGYFVVWLALAILFGVIDRIRGSSLFLPAYFVIAAVVVVAVGRRNRPPNYKFELIGPGAVRSPLGFEVRVSSARVEYSENHHIVSWKPSLPDAAIGKFAISVENITAWDAPFAAEPLDSKKKHDIAQAVRSALVYLQLIDAGKIRPQRQSSR
jgi:hypothetical protein